MTRSATRANIETVIAWLDAMRRKDLDAAVACFAPEVVWEGLVPGVECANRDDVREMFTERIEDDIDADHLEVVGGSDGAVLGVRSPELEELAGVRLNGQLFNVFTIRADRIVRVRDFAQRAPAHEAAGLQDLRGWR
jgi:ketosteroid isomerase-like protein